MCRHKLSIGFVLIWIELLYFTNGDICLGSQSNPRLQINVTNILPTFAKSDTSLFIASDLKSLHSIRYIRVESIGGVTISKPCYIKFYTIQYKREEYSNWITYTVPETGNSNMSGPTDNYSHGSVEVLYPITARWIRFRSNLVKTLEEKPCMVASIYGCPITDDLVEYGLTQPDRNAFKDISYDNHSNSPGSFMSGGMGKLTDGMTGPSGDERTQSRFVGWKKSDVGSNKIDLFFRFSTCRRFENIQFHMSNMFSQGVQVFKRIELGFSVGGVTYKENTKVDVNMLQDDKVQTARWVEVELQSKIGKYVRAKVYFFDKWIRISEIMFNSTPIECPIIEVNPEPTDISPIIVNPLLPNDGSKENSDGYQPGSGVPSFNWRLIIIIVGCVGGILLLVVIILGIVCWYSQHHQLRTKKPPRSVNDDRNNNYNFSHNSSAHQNHHDALNETLQIRLGDRTPVNGVYQMISGNPSEYMSLPRSESDVDRHYSYPHSFQRPGSDISGVQYSGQPGNYIGFGMAPGMPPTSNFMITQNPLELYLSPGRTMAPSGRGLPLPQPPSGQPIYHQMSVQGVVGNSRCLYLEGSPDQSSSTPITARLSHDNMVLVEKLGSGSWGEIHLASLRLGPTPRQRTPGPPARTRTGIRGSPLHAVSTGLGVNGLTATTSEGSEDMDSDPDSNSCLVAVRILRRDASEQARQSFLQEAQQMSRLSHVNICQLLGYLEDRGQLYLVTEYQACEDLHKFLQTHYSLDSPGDSYPLPPNTRTLSRGALIYMSVQIASAMAYLESINVVHRDLACRNCLVDTRYGIKISDLAMSQRQFTTDYCTLAPNVVLPVRWMAWESIRQGIFSSKSDVWSFAVTLWEMLTFCRDQPYAHLSDLQVLDRAALIEAGDSQLEPLQLPHICPKEIRDLVSTCWSRDIHSRPYFVDIHRFLQRSNRGYDPLSDTVSSQMPSSTTLARHALAKQKDIATKPSGIMYSDSKHALISTNC